MVECSIDLDSTSELGSCSGTNSHTPATSLDEGAYIFRVRATDATGNASVETRTFRIGEEGPFLQIDSGPSGPTTDSAPTFQFTAAPGSSLECSIATDATQYAACSAATSHTPAASLGDGSYTFSVKATDSNNRSSVVTRSFTVDLTQPETELEAVAATNDTTPLIGFSANEEVCWV